MTIRTKYNITYAELREYQRNIYRTKQKSFSISLHSYTPPWLSYTVMAGVGLWVLISLIREFMKGASIDGALILGALPILFIVSVVGHSIWSHHQTKKKLVAANDTLIEVDEDHIVIQESLSKMEFAWHFFTHFAETTNLYLLYFSDESAILVPKRAFANEEESHLFRGMAQSGITKAQGFPVQPKST